MFTGVVDSTGILAAASVTRRMDVSLSSRSRPPEASVYLDPLASKSSRFDHTFCHVNCASRCGRPFAVGEDSGETNAVPAGGAPPL